MPEKRHRNGIEFCTVFIFKVIKVITLSSYFMRIKLDKYELLHFNIDRKL